MTRVTAFVYDFSHFKSAQGLIALKLAGYKDVHVVGAPWRKLPLNESTYQFRTQEMQDAQHPRDVARALGYEYEVRDHATVRPRGIGLVLGARVLPREVLTVPIVNLHPGTLPLNRGLDTLKWAVHDYLPQAVAVHRIDARIDRGALLHEEIVPVLPDDSPGDVYARLMWKQIALVPQAVAMAHEAGTPVGRGVYRRPMTHEQDLRTRLRFERYKSVYGTIRAAA